MSNPSVGFIWYMKCLSLPLAKYSLSTYYVLNPGDNQAGCGPANLHMAHLYKAQQQHHLCPESFRYREVLTDVKPHSGALDQPFL